MARKRQKKTVEFRYYDIPKGELILPLLGREWLRPYGRGFGKYHFHNYMEIGICYFGKGMTYLNDDMGYEFKSGSIVIIPPNIMHTMLSENESLAFWEWFYIDVRGILSDMKYLETMKIKVSDIVNVLNEEAFLFHMSEYPKMGELIKEIRDECDEKNFLYGHKIRVLLQNFIVELLRMKEMNCDIENAKKKTTNMVQPAISYMEVHYGEEIKIKRLADVCGMSESHFRRVFTEYMNMTPNSFVNVVRVRHACKLLTETELSTNDIAYKAGFIDSSTFHRNFKKALGMTPSQWRNSHSKQVNRKQYFNITALKGW